MGQRFPTAAQTPYFNMSAFAYPDAYTIGSLGSRVLEAPALFWMQCFRHQELESRRGAPEAQSPAGRSQSAAKNPNLAAPNTHTT